MTNFSAAKTSHAIVSNGPNHPGARGFAVRVWQVRDYAKSDLWSRDSNKCARCPCRVLAVWPATKEMTCRSTRQVDHLFGAELSLGGSPRRGSLPAGRFLHSPPFAASHALRTIKCRGCSKPVFPSNQTRFQ